MGTSKTSRYYASNPKAAEKRREDQRKRNKIVFWLIVQQ